MLKKLVLALLVFGSGIVGNLLATWIEADAQKITEDGFGVNRLVGAAIGALVMTVLIILLDATPKVPWNWRWHRFWYLVGILQDQDLRQSRIPFARLDLAQLRRKLPAPEVITDGKRQDLIKVLRQIVGDRHNNMRRALVLGEPGSGKTTGLEQLTLELARSGAWRLGFGQAIPLLVRLGNFQNGSLLEYIGQAVHHGIQGKSGKILAQCIEPLIEKGHIILLFDALDEALGERREIVLAELGTLLQSRAYSEVPIVITSRTRENPGDRLRGMHVFEVQDLSDDAVTSFIQAYAPLEHNEDNIKQRLKAHDLLGERGLGRNPFWLQLILESGTFEENKSQLLNQAVNTLLMREWDGKPKTERSWRRVLPRDEQLEETKRALAWLGYQLSLDHAVQVDLTKALTIVGDWLKARVGVELLRPQDVLGLGQDSQILMYEFGPIRFRHRLLQEFMVAWALKVESASLTQGLERCVQDSEWWETLFMLGGLLEEQDAPEAGDEHNHLIRFVVGDGRDLRRLFLAIGLLGSSSKQRQPLKQQLMRRLIDSLGEADPSHILAAVAVSKLAERPIVEALSAAVRKGRLLIQAHAINILGHIKSTYSVKVLGQYLGVRDQRIADWAIEALISIGELSVGTLIQLLQEASSADKRIIYGLGQIGVPAIAPLLQIVRSGTWWVREEATEALGQIGSPAVAPLIEALQDADSEVRRCAVEALGQIGSPAVAPLIEALQDADSEVRRCAVEALGRNEDLRAIDALIILLQDPDGWVSQAAADSLRRIGPVAVGPLLSALPGARRVLHQEIVELLGQSGDVRAVEPLIAHLRTKDYEIRRGIAEALGQIGILAVDPLMVALRDVDGHVRQAAVWALRKIGSPAVIPLISALSDSRREVRQLAAWALVKIGAPSVEPLLQAVGDANWWVRWTAIQILGQIKVAWAWNAGLSHVKLRGDHRHSRQIVEPAARPIDNPPSIDPLIVLLRDKNTWVRQGTIEALGWIGAPAVEALIARLEDQEASVRLAAVQVLGRIGDRRAVEPLIARLEDQEASVRLAAVQVLGRIGDRRVVEPLIARLQDVDQEIRQAVVCALEGTGSSAIEVLIATLRHANSQLHQAMIEVLGWIGAPAIDPLLQLLEDQEASVRLAAVQVLGRIGDRRAVEALIARLEDQEASVRLAAVQVLGQIGGVQVVMRLLPALRGENKPGRQLAIRVVRLIGYKWLIKLKQTTNFLVHQQVYYVAKQGEQLGSQIVVDILILMLQFGSKRMRQTAAELLGRMETAYAVESLVTALDDEDYTVRCASVVALGAIGDFQAVPPLISKLQDQYPEVRRTAVTALGQIDDVRVIDVLAAMLKDEEHTVRQAAAWSLGKVGDARILVWGVSQTCEPVVQPLIVALQDQDTLVRQAAAWALGRIGDTRAVTPLLALSQDQDNLVSQAATGALGQLGNLRIPSHV